MEKKTYSRAVLPQRLAALFDGHAWRYHAANSDLCLAEGRIAGRKVLAVATDLSASMGTFGMGECADFQWALLHARATGVPLLLLIDSAGTRLTDGLPVQGAIRALMREMLDARLAGLPMLAVLGRYAFGSASMLAFTAHERLYSGGTQLAMSGPRVLQAALDESTSRDTVLNQINGISRTAIGNADRLIDDDLDAYADVVREWIANPAVASVTHEALMQERGHLSQRLSCGAPGAGDLPLLDGDTLRCLTGRPFSAADAIIVAELAEAACTNAGTKWATLVIDCPGHSVSLQDEAVILSQYLAHLALSLRYLVHAGSLIRLRIIGSVSGGIYIALAAAASITELTPGAVIRTLPRSSLVHIFGDGVQESEDSASYVEWGLVDSVLPEHESGIDSNLFLFQRQSGHSGHAHDLRLRK